MKIQTPTPNQPSQTTAYQNMTKPAVPVTFSIEPSSCHGDHLSAVRERQRQYFYSGATKPYKFRMEQLKRLRAAIKQFEPEIIQALQADLGRNPSESFLAEIGFLYDEIRHTLAQLKTWMKPEKVSTPLLLAPAKSQIISEALGEVLIISPWNYPFQLLMAPVIGAIAAGNCLVLKPSELSPHTSKIIAKLVMESFPAEYITVFEGGIDVSQALLDQAWDHIFFTGSTAVGTIIAQAAARFLTPVTLELGGKSPAIVDETANLEIAARRIVFGKFVNAGQTCIAPDYVLVHKSRRDALVQHLSREIQRFYGSDVRKSDSYSRIINERHFDRLTNLMQEATIATGGAIEREQLFIEPTIFVEVQNDHAIMQEEIFGPLLPVLTYETYDEVLQQVRSQAKPLALYLFTENKTMQKQVLADLSFGGGAVNDTVVHFLNSEMPFGGVGASGIGAAHGIHSFRTFSHRKSVLINTSKVDLPVRYAPYQPYKAKLIRLLMDRHMSTTKFISLVTISLFFIIAGVNHFVNPVFYLKMMPPYIPFHEAMVYLSGLFEVILGVAVLVPKLRHLAAWGMIALLLAVFPANIYMYTHAELFPDVPLWAHYIRLPLQAAFLYWAYQFTKKS